MIGLAVLWGVRHLGISELGRSDNQKAG